MFKLKIRFFIVFSWTFNIFVYILQTGANSSSKAERPLHRSCRRIVSGVRIGVCWSSIVVQRCRHSRIVWIIDIRVGRIVAVFTWRFVRRFRVEVVWSLLELEELVVSDEHSSFAQDEAINNHIFNISSPKIMRRSLQYRNNYYPDWKSEDICARRYNLTYHSLRFLSFT